MRGWRTLSLQARQLLAASLALVAFLAFTGYALDRAFVDTAQNALRERLANLALGYIYGSEIDRSGAFIPPEPPLDVRFMVPKSGLYASVRGDNLRWNSASSFGRSLPPLEMLEQGERRFEGPLSIVDGRGTENSVYAYSIGVVWESSQDTPLTISVFEDAGQIQDQVNVFRRALWGYLGFAAVVLVLVQILVLRWSLLPLRNVERELARVRQGESLRLSGAHPRELESITESINSLIESERSHLERSRNTLSDLAHSLKTPLAVLRSRLDADASHDELRRDVAGQVQRMNEIVSYQLSRAARSGHALYSAPIEIEPRAEEIVAGLEKVYVARGVLCEFDIDSAARFHGELGDLQELLGNLLENAFKWANKRVLLSVKVETAPANRRPGTVITVDDDGPGIPPEKVELLLQRGVRGDERVQGHGIGLSIVQDIVTAYRGELSVGQATELGGARFRVRFPPAF
ncbi:ATP-binding protein [Arenimonas sp. MALMAid1274]|uniref:ATP-binding protein n=1 Tax=Arenimonas sp. MALMAid1274 TaxID=3411630 RepID=UPI003BA0295B